jgi:predicted DNA binding protein
MSPYIADVHVAHPDFAFSDTIESVPDVRLHRETLPVVAEDTILFFFSAEGGDFSAFETAFERNSSGESLQSIAEFDDRRVYCARLVRDEIKLITPQLSNQGMQILTAKSGDGGWFIQVLGNDRESLSSFHDYCTEQEISFSLIRMYQADTDPLQQRYTEKFGLTARQAEVARVATERGYFERNGIAAEEVAAELGISTSTLSDHLRVATAKVFRHLFLEE